MRRAGAIAREDLMRMDAAEKGKWKLLSIVYEIYESLTRNKANTVFRQRLRCGDACALDPSLVG